MSDFKKYKFSELYEMSSGISSKPEQAGHGFPFLSFKTVFNNYFLPDELEDLMDTSARDRNSSSIKKGDIFLTRTSETLDELGMSAVAVKDYPDATFSGFLKRLRPLQDHITYDKYMAFYLRSKYFRKIMTNNSIMTLRASLNEQIFSYLNLILPDYEAQKNIGDLLYSLNQKIEVNNKINAELEAMAKTLYDYWFVQFDFPNEEGEPYKTSGGEMEYNEVLKREIPVGWEVKGLGEIANITMGQSPKGESYNELGIGKIFYQGSTDFGWRFPSIRKFTTEPNRLAFEGDILLSVRAPVGTYNIANDDCCIGRGLAAIKSKDSFNGFLLGQINLFKKKFDNANSIGTTFGSINKDELHCLTLCYPDKTQLAKFESYAGLWNNQIAVNSKQNLELASLRDWLLPMLMNGQVSVESSYASRELKTEPIQMAAEPVVEYGRIIKLSIPDKSKGFAKQVLGGKIVSLFKDDPNFTHIKFQKLQYLAEHIAEADLDLNYYFQTAGPHDGRFMHTIADKFKNSKWFEERNYKFYPLEKQDKIDGYYRGYFAPAQDRLDKLFLLLANATEAEAEIYATLYAVWNNRIILKQPISESNIIEDFYKWSDRKLQYSKTQLLESLAVLRTNHMVPTGFGKEIKTAKTKSK